MIIKLCETVYSQSCDLLWPCDPITAIDTEKRTILFDSWMKHLLIITYCLILFISSCQVLITKYNIFINTLEQFQKYMAVLF